MRGTRRQVLAGVAAAGALGAARVAWAGTGGAPMVLVDEAAGADWRETLKPWTAGSSRVRRVADGALLDPVALTRDAGVSGGGRLVTLLGSANHLLLMEALRDAGGRVLLEQRLDAGRPTHMTLAMLPAQGRLA